MAEQEVLDKFGNLEHLAIEALADFLSGDGGDPTLREKARVAQATLGTISRNRQTDNARDALQFQMAHSLTNDPDRLAEYIRTTQPHSAMAKALPAKAS